MTRTSRVIWLSASGWLTLLGFAMAQVPGAGEAETSLARDLTIGQRPIYDFVQQQQAAQSQRPPDQRVPVEVWTDRVDGTFRIGDPVALNVRPRRDAHITVLNIGSSGRATVLFPNQLQRESRVRANQVLTLGGPGSGYSIVPQGPAGVELVHVVASTRPLTLAELTKLTETPGTSPFLTLGRSAEEVARDLAVQTTGAQASAQGPTGIATMMIRVLPQAQSAATTPPAGAAPPPQAQQLLTLLQQMGVPAAPVTTTGPAPVGGGTTPAVTLPPGFGTPSLLIRTDKAIYGVQDTVQISVAALADCRLSLLSIGPTGQVAQLFPNPAQGETLLRAGQVMMVPPVGSHVAIRPRGTAGMETIIGLCAQRNGDAAPSALALQAQRDLGAVTTAVATATPSPSSVSAAAAVYFVRQ